MSNVGNVDAALTTWEEFLQLPDTENGTHYELHDGEVVAVPPPKPNHIFIQSVLVEWLTSTAQGRGRAASEFPYRPAPNLQFWYADVAYVPREDWLLMRADEYPVYAPPLVIEVLSPSNTPEKIHRQRVAAFSGGTSEFWVVDPAAYTVEVSLPGNPPRIYRTDETIPVIGTFFPVSILFEH
jgi:Uma2 family endonuclease